MYLRFSHSGGRYFPPDDAIILDDRPQKKNVQPVEIEGELSPRRDEGRRRSGTFPARAVG